MKKIIAFLLVMVGVIHILPVAGVMGADRLIMLYGIEVTDPNFDILMRHRAILFGLLGLFIIYAAFKPMLQLLAIVAGLISVVSFLAIALIVGDYNGAIYKVIMVDIIALVALCSASVLYVMERYRVKE